MLGDQQKPAHSNGKHVACPGACLETPRLPPLLLRTHSPEHHTTPRRAQHKQEYHSRCPSPGSKKVAITLAWEPAAKCPVKQPTCPSRPACIAGQCGYQVGAQLLLNHAHLPLINQADLIQSIDDTTKSVLQTQTWEGGAGQTLDTAVHTATASTHSPERICPASRPSCSVASRTH